MVQRFTPAQRCTCRNSSPFIPVLPLGQRWISTMDSSMAQVGLQLLRHDTVPPVWKIIQDLFGKKRIAMPRPHATVVRHHPDETTWRTNVRLQTTEIFACVCVSFLFKGTELMLINRGNIDLSELSMSKSRCGRTGADLEDHRAWEVHTGIHFQEKRTGS